jgi:hypothetical protein
MKELQYCSALQHAKNKLISCIYTIAAAVSARGISQRKQTLMKHRPSDETAAK